LFDAAEDGRKKSLDCLDGRQTRGLAYPAQIIGFPITLGRVLSPDSISSAHPRRGRCVLRLDGFLKRVPQCMQYRASVGLSFPHFASHFAQLAASGSPFAVPIRQLDSST
jgi:hypothetical protein